MADWKSENKTLEATEVLINTLIADSSDGGVGEFAKFHFETGGKRLRARLALEAVHALTLNFSASKAVGWAAACELLHNASLVHDDIQDGDRVRRGKPTVWVRCGVAQAINVGDLMWMLSIRAIENLEVQDSIKWHLANLLCRAAVEIIRGQGRELSMTSLTVDAPLPNKKAYYQMVQRKTSALFELPVKGAAYLANKNDAEAQKLALPFRRLGVLFQVQDHFLDLYADKGREVRGSDLYEGKLSALVVECVEHTPEAWPELKTILLKSRNETSEKDVEYVENCFEKAEVKKRLSQWIFNEHQSIVEGNELREYPQLMEVLSTLATQILHPIENALNR